MPTTPVKSAPLAKTAIGKACPVPAFRTASILVGLVHLACQ
jgi:hypothetical protein